MNPQAALDLDRQAYAPALFDQHRNNITTSTAESQPETYTSSEGKEFLAYPGFPETGETEYQNVKKQMEILDYNIYTSNHENQRRYDQLNNANLRRSEMQYQQALVADQRKSLSPTEPTFSPPPGGDSSSEFNYDDDPTLFNTQPDLTTVPPPALTKNQKKNANRRKRDYKRHVAEAIANKTVEMNKQKAVTEKLKYEMELTMQDIFDMEQCRRALDETGVGSRVWRNMGEKEEERRFIEESLRKIHADRVKLEEEIRDSEQEWRAR